MKSFKLKNNYTLKVNGKTILECTEDEKTLRKQHSGVNNLFMLYNSYDREIECVGNLQWLFFKYPKLFTKAITKELKELYTF